MAFQSNGFQSNAFQMKRSVTNPNTAGYKYFHRPDKQKIAIKIRNDDGDIETIVKAFIDYIL
jgi:hypothetical protein